jgi:hypothetical protein
LYGMALRTSSRRRGHQTRQLARARGRLRDARGEETPAAVASRAADGPSRDRGEARRGAGARKRRARARRLETRGETRAGFRRVPSHTGPHTTAIAW